MGIENPTLKMRKFITKGFVVQPNIVMMSEIFGIVIAKAKQTITIHIEIRKFYSLVIPEGKISSSNTSLAGSTHRGAPAKTVNKTPIVAT